AGGLNGQRPRRISAEVPCPIYASNHVGARWLTGAVTFRCPTHIDGSLTPGLLSACPTPGLGGSAMKCPRCQQENPPQAKFCLECAAPLALQCANCRTQLPAGAKFCFAC